MNQLRISFLSLILLIFSTFVLDVSACSSQFFAQTDEDLRRLAVFLAQERKVDTAGTTQGVQKTNPSTIVKEKKQ